VLPYVHRVVEMADGRVHAAPAGAVPRPPPPLPLLGREDRLASELVI
jgi:hypothetical protein